MRYCRGCQGPLEELDHEIGKLESKNAILEEKIKRIEEAAHILDGAKRPYKDESGVIEFTLGAWSNFACVALKGR